MLCHDNTILFFLELHFIVKDTLFDIKLNFKIRLVLQNFTINIYIIFT